MKKKEKVKQIIQYLELLPVIECLMKEFEPDRLKKQNAKFIQNRIKDETPGFNDLK